MTRYTVTSTYYSEPVTYENIPLDSVAAVVSVGDYVTLTIHDEPGLICRRDDEGVLALAGAWYLRQTSQPAPPAYAEMEGKPHPTLWPLMMR